MGLILYRFLHVILTILFLILYLRIFTGNPIFIGVMLALFAYSVSAPISLLVNFIVYIFTSPRLLKEDRSIIENGIPKDLTIASFRPIFAKTFTEMESLLRSMEQDITNNQTPNKNIKFIDK